MTDDQPRPSEAIMVALSMAVRSAKKERGATSWDVTSAIGRWLAMEAHRQEGGGPRTRAALELALERVCEAAVTVHEFVMAAKEAKGDK